jgi:hypothetical protein
VERNAYKISSLSMGNELSRYHTVNLFYAGLPEGHN